MEGPKNDYMQGIGKFVSPSIYFDTPRNIDRLENVQVVFEEWLAKHDADIEKLWQEIRKKPKYSDIGSSNLPMDDACMHDTDNIETN